ncbi:MAG: dihydrodipicolinate synthase family protein [Bryobacterales bacterium]|nr:dihydrodipicolinate synthase family protein [Bryobacterales bacterium]
MNPNASEMARPRRRDFLKTAAGAAVLSASLPAASAKEPFRGVYTIPSTPFRPNGDLDIPGFRRVVDFCVACGAHGLVFPVNASEWSALSDDERLRLDQVLVERNAGRVPVVIGVNASTQEHAGRFAAHAREIGADAVIAMPPRGVQSEEVIFNFYRRIAEAGRLPVFLQDHDPPVGTPLSVEFMLRMCREIEYVRYIKEETSPSTFRTTAILKRGAGLCKGVFGGAGGRYLIEEHRRGCAGQMPGCHVTDVVVALWNALEKGDRARAMHIYKEMAPLFFFESPLSGCYKEVLYRRGVIDCPLKRNGPMPMDETASRYLDEILKDLAPLMTWKK